MGWWELLERRAAMWPWSTALVADDVGWTFRQVDVLSNRLAHALREAGARPGTVVACAMTRSVRAVLGALATAKTGATYLPIDPALPRARLAAIIADAGPVVLVTDTPAVSAGSVARMALDPEAWQSDLDGYDCRSLHQAVQGPAYVVYTSGSTGEAKGVVVGNESVVNLYGELSARFFPLAGHDGRVAHGMPLAFDASFDPLLWMVGGYQTHLVPDEVRTDPDRYVRFVRDHRLSIVELVPAHLVTMVEAGLLDADARPDLLLVGGEAIGQSLWSRLRATPDLTAVNLYGPTECTVFATSCRMDGCETPAVGRPIRNTRTRVVDDELRPVPVGETGELLVGGDCLAVGYLNRPGLTAERFVERIGRWYRTGDLCRWRSDRQLEWMGRIDDQVKIRGHRVEPGDTEHALLGMPQVRQAVVLAEGDDEDRRLVAYVVLAAGGHDDGVSVRAQLRAVLPEYLVPSAVVTVDAMPLGPTGKIDRAVLRTATRATAPADVLSPAQELVADAFRAVLGNPVVTARSDFFDLGGHSLSAATVAARLRAQGVTCSLRDVLRHRTVCQLATLVPARYLETTKEP